MGLDWLLFIQLFCMPVKVQFPQNLPFDELDQQTLVRAARHCYEEKYPRNPCLKLFVRFPPKQAFEHHYFALCGTEEGYIEGEYAPDYETINP